MTWDWNAVLSGIGAAIAAWDWSGFLSTLVATLAGALVSIAVTWRIFNRQRIDRRAELFEGALAELMRVEGEYSVAVRHAARVSHITWDPPSNGQITSALAVASMIANQDEYRVLHAFSSVNAFAESYDWGRLASTHEAAQALLMIWRRGMVTTDKAESDFKTMADDALRHLKDRSLWESQ